MDQITVILPAPANGARQSPHQYPINVLRRSSAYFDALLSDRWLERQDDWCENIDCSVSPVVDLSQTDLHPAACTSVLRFLVLRYRSEEGAEDDAYGERDGDARVEKAPHNEVTAEEIKELLWDGFKWDEEDSRRSSKKSDEMALYHAIDYLHIDHQDEILSKLWAVKIVECPCSLESALKEEGLVGERCTVGMHIKKMPQYTGWSNMTQRTWRFLVCLFMCRRLECGETDNVSKEQHSDANGNAGEVRSQNYQRRLGTYSALNQLSRLCSGLGEEPLLLLREFVHIGLLAKDGSAYWQTSLDGQVMLLWKLLGLTG